MIDNQEKLVKKNPKCKLLIIGDGPDIDKFKAQAKKLGIEKNVIFTGKIPWIDIHKYYQIPQVFVTASHTETQGLTLLEAMAASVPVVGYDDEAFRDVVIPDLNGYLFKDNDDYIEYIERIMKDKKLLERLSRQSRINAESHSAKYYAERVLDVYNTALDGTTSGGEKKTFVSTMKSVLKKGLHGK